MQNKYQNQLKERLTVYKMWKNGWDLYFFHKSITEKAKKKGFSKTGKKSNANMTASFV